MKKNLLCVLGGCFLLWFLFECYNGRDSVPLMRCEADIYMLITQLKIFKEINGDYPTQEEGLKALVERPPNEKYQKTWRQLLVSMPLDPWGKEYIYRYPSKLSSNPYDLYTLGKDLNKHEIIAANWLLKKDDFKKSVE